MSDRIGRYELVRSLASSDRGKVFLARAPGLGGYARHVVVKTFELVGAAEGPFIEEIEHLGRLQHQHIAPILDVGRDGGTFYVVLDYVHGRSAREVWEQTFTLGALLPVDFTLTVIANAASGLHYAHTRRRADGRSLGVLHGHVSLSNVMIGYDGSVQLIGFAGSATRAQRASETQLGFARDQLAYLSPEQVRRQELDVRSDLFGLGVLLYELTTMRRAFRDDSDRLTLERIKSGSYVNPRKIVPDYPPELERVVARALQLDREARYPDAESMRRELTALGHRFELVLGDAAIIEVMTQLFDDARVDPWVPDLPVETKREVTPVPVESAPRKPLRAATETVDALAIELEIPVEALFDGKTTAESDAVDNDTMPVPAIAEVPKDAVTKETGPHAIVPPARTSASNVSAVGSATAALAALASVSDNTDSVPVVAPSAPAVAPAKVLPPAPPRRRIDYRVIGVVSVIAAIVVTTVVAIALRGTHKAKPTAKPPVDAAIVAPPIDAPPRIDAAPIDASTKIKIHVTTTPAGATVVLDNQRLGKTPYDGELDRADGKHVLKVRLRGFTGARRDVVLTGDISEDITLAPAPAADAGADSPGSALVVPD